MNRENILKVADAIERRSIPDLGFNLAEWLAPRDDDTPDTSGHNCGTVACVAGWAVAVLAPDAFEEGAVDPHFAAGLLGFDNYPSARRLFNPGVIIGDVGYNDVTSTHAVAVLRHLAETGEVDWTIGAPQSEEVA